MDGYINHAQPCCSFTTVSELDPVEANFSAEDIPDDFAYDEFITAVNEANFEASTCTPWEPSHSEVVHGMELQSVDSFFSSNENPAYDTLPF